MPSSENSDSPAPQHKRRKRYAGTHPKRFDERYKELAADPEMIGHVRAQGRTPAGMHVPIMLGEVMRELAPREGDIVADCTLGYGGHAIEFLRRIGPVGRLVGFDADAAQLERTRARLIGAASVSERTNQPASADVVGPLPDGRGSEKTALPSMTLVHSNFAGLAKPLAGLGIDGYDVIFADVGVSSMQVDDPARGFSYKADGPLDMRMDNRTKASAADVLARISQADLSQALLELADEEDCEAIAAAIVAQRRQAPIARTLELAELVMETKGVSPRQWRQMSGRSAHPAAKTFQALRILVNDELGSLRALLRAAPFCLRPGGRIGILTFHSGEARLVKHAFREGQEAGHYVAISDEVIRPSSKEVHDNPRSAAAKFRWARRTFSGPEGIK